MEVGGGQTKGANATASLLTQAWWRGRGGEVERRSASPPPRRQRSAPCRPPAPFPPPKPHHSMDSGARCLQVPKTTACPVGEGGGRRKAERLRTWLADRARRDLPSGECAGGWSFLLLWGACRGRDAIAQKNPDKSLGMPWRAGAAPRPVPPDPPVARSSFLPITAPRDVAYANHHEEGRANECRSSSP